MEPLTAGSLEKIIAQANGRTAFWPTLGGQTGLNLAMELDEKGISDRNTTCSFWAPTSIPSAAPKTARISKT